MRSSTTLVLLFAASAALGQPPAGYYDTAAGLSGEPLRQALHDIIDGHNSLSYAQLWSAFQTTDVRPDGKVWDIYSDVPGGTAPYSYTFVNDQCGTYNSEGDCYNREHTFPSDWFNDAFPMYTDLFQVMPTDGFVNNKRGNLPYGLVGAVDWTSQNGTRTGMANVQGYSGTVCEPIDAFKGDVARNYFYMLTRYKDEAVSWNSDMLANGDLSNWAEYLLLQWHQNDPVDTKEQARNNAVFALQGNRNPYIDHPEWVVSVWGATASIPDHQPGGGPVLRGDVLSYPLGGIPSGPVRVLDMLGRTVWASPWSGAELRMPDLPGGTYLVWHGPYTLRFTR